MKWIGVDLDGTLARNRGNSGPGDIGPPIPEMIDRVRMWLEQGRKVKIFTARATDKEQIPFIKQWLKAAGLGDLEITNVKDYDMASLWDDRAIRVKRNTGEVAEQVASHLLKG